MNRQIFRTLTGNGLTDRLRGFNKYATAIKNSPCAETATALNIPDFLNGLKATGRICNKTCSLALQNRHSVGHDAKSMIEYLAAIDMDDLARPGCKLDAEALTRELARQTSHDYLRIDPLRVDVDKVTRVMDYKFSRRHQILCIEVGADEVVIASADPSLTGWESVLEQTSRKNVRRVIANPLDIEKLTDEFYRVSRSIRGATRSSTIGKGIGNLEQMLELGARTGSEANDQHIVNVVDWFLQYAFEQRASDIHIEPGSQDGRIRLRIDGMLHTVYALPEQVCSAVTCRLKILGRMNVAEKRQPQNGRIKTRSPGGLEIELRLSTMPTAYGEKLVLRIFSPEVLLKPLPELGLAGEDLQRWKSVINRNHGMVIITGPTGSGKTTTLYSTLRSLATEALNVCTIEDPVEMTVDSFNQMQVLETIDLGFAQGVRALLRQDPDIIMIGEVRDLETAEMAIQAALTGHLVFTTLHTSDAPAAITRLLELGVPAYLIKATVAGVLAQRLLRALCKYCRQPAQVGQEAWDMLTRPWNVKLPTTGQNATGCPECRETGYSGREAVFEVMPFTDALQRFTDDTSVLPELRRHAYSEGMLSLRLSGARKVAAGLTTVNEVLRVTPETGS